MDFCSIKTAIQSFATEKSYWKDTSFTGELSPKKKEVKRSNEKDRNNVRLDDAKKF